MPNSVWSRESIAKQTKKHVLALSRIQTLGIRVCSLWATNVTYKTLLPCWTKRKYKQTVRLVP